MRKACLPLQTRLEDNAESTDSMLYYKAQTQAQTMLKAQKAQCLGAIY